MPVSEQLYNMAMFINNNLLPYVRHVTPDDTLMPDDYNVCFEILKAYLTTLNQVVYAKRETVAMHDDVYYLDIEDLRRLAYNLWYTINTDLGDPYASDPDFINLKTMLYSVPPKAYGDLLSDAEWNVVFDFCKIITGVILKYPVGITVDIVFFG